MGCSESKYGAQGAARVDKVSTELYKHPTVARYSPTVIELYKHPGVSRYSPTV